MKSRDALKNRKIILSTGIGRLHMVQSAQHLSEAGLDVLLIQGWVHTRLPSFLMRFLGLVGGSKDLQASLNKRQIVGVELKENILSDFFTHGLFLLNRIGFLPRGIAARIGWWCFGFQTKRYLVDGDIFHVRSGAGRGGAIEFARKMGLAIVVDHSIAHPGFMEEKLAAEFRALGIPSWISESDPFWRGVLADCKDADILLVNSDFVKQTFVDRGFPKYKIRVVYLGVRPDFFGLKKTYQVGSVLKLLFVGGLGARKGVRPLILALEYLCQTGLLFELTVIGSADEAKDYILASEMSPYVKLVGPIPQDDLKRYLAESDIFVFPSLAEGCASAGMEAMAAGLPVVATRESGLPIIHGENGLQVDVTQPGAIGDAIQELHKSELLREKLGREAADVISRQFTWENYAEKLETVYVDLLERAAR